MNQQIPRTERVYNSPAFLTTAGTVFVVTTFSFVLGFFYLALGAAILVSLGLSLVLPFITTRGTHESFTTGFLRAFLGGVVGLICVLLVFLAISLFVG